MVKAGFRPKLDAFLFFDFEQIEYRLLAFYLAVPPISAKGMAGVFERGDDLHAEVAKVVLGLDRAPTDLERDVGKTQNFATIYGQGATKCALTLGVSKKVAQGYLDAFNEQWPEIKKLHNPPFRNGGYRDGEGPGLIQRQLAGRGYISTLWGRRLKPDAPHKALNSLVQGCAADLMRYSLIQVHEALYGLKSHIVNVVHDEIILDVVRAEIPLLVDTIPSLMNYEPISEVVPIGVDTEISWTNWADKEKYAPDNDGQPDDLGRVGPRDEEAPFPTFL